MTIIVAVRDSDTLTLASDTRVSSDDTVLSLHRDGPLKIGTNGDYLIGAAGRLRTGQVLMNSSIVQPHPNLSIEELTRFMIREFSPSVQSELHAAGVEQVSDSERLLTESEVIVCAAGIPFAVGEDYSIMRGETIGDYEVTVVGSGYRLALGAAYGALSSGFDRSSYDLARMMCAAAVRWDPYCGGDIVSVSQKVTATS